MQSILRDIEGRIVHDCDIVLVDNCFDVAIKRKSYFLLYASKAFLTQEFVKRHNVKIEHSNRIAVRKKKLFACEHCNQKCSLKERSNFAPYLILDSQCEFYSEYFLRKLQNDNLFEKQVLE